MPDPMADEYLERLRRLMPGAPSMEAALASQRKTAEALREAGQIWRDGVQAIVEREVEMVSRSLDDMAALAAIDAKNAPDQAASARIEAIRAMYEAGVANAREVADIAAKSAEEAMDVLNARALETFDELSTTLAAVDPGDATPGGAAAGDGGSAGDSREEAATSKPAPARKTRKAPETPASPTAAKAAGKPAEARVGGAAN